MFFIVVAGTIFSHDRAKDVFVRPSVGRSVTSSVRNQFLCLLGATHGVYISLFQVAQYMSSKDGRPVNDELDYVRGNKALAVIE